MNYIVSLILAKMISLGKEVAQAIKKFILMLEYKSQLAVEKKRAASSITNTVGQQPKKERVCHFDELFINYKGDVFPCCTTWTRPYMRIGHVKDENLLESIESFYANCSCEYFKLKRGSAKNKKKYSYLNVELSLACQGKCAMCCVESPAWKGKYDYYESCTKIVNQLKPKEIVLQGGEVLIQKKSLKWVAEIKKKHPDVKIALVTNGNVDLNMIETVENLFDRLSISMVGFQAETYKRIMGMDFEKMVKFVEELAKRKKVTLVLKYLTTPLNIHEANLFLEWAIKLDPVLAYLDDASSIRYINPAAPYKFWSKIFNRTGQEIKSLLIANKDKLLEKNMKIQFRNSSLVLLGLNKDFEEFLEKNGLLKKVGRLSSTNLVKH